MERVRLHFVSFGSRQHYLRLSRQTLNEVASLYPDANCVAISTRDLGKDTVELRRYAREFPKGYGYWSWKPLAVQYALERSAPGDVVIYLDGRSGIPKKSVPWIRELQEDPVLALCALQMTSHPEYMWTTGDLFELFGFSIQGPEAVSGQFAGGLFGFRNTEATRTLLNEWRSVVVSRRELCRDEPSVRPNHPSFVENRYDQSAFSLTVKKYLNMGLPVRILGSTDVTGDSAIQPQVKEHPLRIPIPSSVRRIMKSAIRRSSAAHLR